jgi:hypothetical protein
MDNDFLGYEMGRNIHQDNYVSGWKDNLEEYLGIYLLLRGILVRKDILEIGG